MMMKLIWKPKTQLMTAGRMIAAVLTEETKTAGLAKSVALEKIRFPVMIADQK